MSDNVIIFGIGGAGVNTVRALGYDNSAFIDSRKFQSLENVVDFVGKVKNGDKVVIVTSPAGEFSSSVLGPICTHFNSKGNRVLLVSIMPFHSESPERKRRGEILVREVEKFVDTSVIVENENFASAMQDYPLTTVLDSINSYVRSLVRNFISSNGKESTVEAKTAYRERESSGARTTFSAN